MPAYDLGVFVGACRKAASVFVAGGAMETARRDFGLNSQPEVVAFIGNGGLEHPVHANTAPWQNNPDPSDPILVDSYNFYSGSRYGYMAFFRAPSANWVVKSFKANDRPDPRVRLLAWLPGRQPR